MGNQSLDRRHCIVVLAGSTVWPLAARAQRPAMPVVGFLSSRSPHESASAVAAFRQSLSEAGYIEGKNLALAFAGPRVNTVGCPHWRPIWLAVR
jgi:putative ABC transport system substrate-binding protein